MPKVQDVLKSYVKTDLGKNINSDEAAALGAVYKAADLATGFRVAKFVVKEAVLFPILVTFEREGASGDTKLVKRQLFTAFGSYPQKKMITFNKNMEDFTFEVKYGDLDNHLPDHEIKHIGSMNLLKINLKDVAKIISANTGENIEPKGIKAHFVLDDSGLFSLSGIEFLADKNVTEPEEESSFAKLGSTITKLFSGNDDEKKETDEKPTEASSEGEQDSSDDDKKSPDLNANTTKSSNETESTKTTEKKPASKIVNIKEPIPHEIDIMYTVHLKGDKFEEARKKVDSLDELERQIERRESALNALESFVIEANQRLDEDEYASCATSDEIEIVRKACGEVQEWIYEDGEAADAETYEKKLAELSEKTNPIYARRWEHNERPDAIESFTKMITHAKTFLTNAKTMTKEANVEKDVFTQVEIDTLQKAIDDAEKWLENEQKAQNKLKKYEPVKLTVKAIGDRMMLLDREVKYLINKLKIWMPKVKDLPKKAKKSVNETETVTNETVTIETPTNETSESVDQPAKVDEEQQPTTDSDDRQDTHSEL